MKLKLFPKRTLNSCTFWPNILYCKLINCNCEMHKSLLGATLCVSHKVQLHSTQAGNIKILLKIRPSRFTTLVYTVLFVNMFCHTQCNFHECVEGNYCMNRHTLFISIVRDNYIEINAKYCDSVLQQRH